METITYKWTIFIADLNPVKGSEQKGKRPVLVISDDMFNQVMPVVSILPITSLKKGRRIYPNEVMLPKGTAGLPRDSLVLVHQIRTISKKRLQNALGLIRETEFMETINNALRVHLNL